MIIVIIPDNGGKNIKDGKLYSSIHSLYPETIVVPLLNGQNSEELKSLAERHRISWLEPLACKDNTRGLVGALMEGYEHVLNEYHGATIVRMDTAEHDIIHIGTLAAAAEKHGAVVAELDFSQGGLVEGSYDYYIHEQVFPEMYGAVTKGRLRLSCAHGFQAFEAQAADAALGFAGELIEEVEKYTGEPMKWGFDAAMVVGAIAAGVRVEMLKVPATGLPRNRDKAKINAQYRNHQMLLMAIYRQGIIT